jgi:hypothetical protein
MSRASERDIGAFAAHHAKIGNDQGSALTKLLIPQQKNRPSTISVLSPPALQVFS